MMSVYEVLIVVGIPSIISGIVAIMINRGMRRRDISQQIIRAQNAELEKQNKAMMHGVQALLQDRLLQGYRHYAEKGWADFDDRQVMENLYQQYHGLGKNGIMDGYRERFQALPTRPDNPS